MSTIVKGDSLAALLLRKRLGREDWHAPEPFGPAGWIMISNTPPGEPLASVIVSLAPVDPIIQPPPGMEGLLWLHASITGPGRMPTYGELVTLHKAVWGPEGYAYEVHAPDAQHVNFHAHARHLWGRADGKPILPEFGKLGMI